MGLVFPDCIDKTKGWKRKRVAEKLIALDYTAV